MGNLYSTKVGQKLLIISLFANLCTTSLLISLKNIVSLRPPRLFSATLLNFTAISLQTRKIFQQSILQSLQPYNLSLISLQPCNFRTIPLQSFCKRFCYLTVIFPQSLITSSRDFSTTPQHLPAISLQSRKS